MGGAVYDRCSILITAVMSGLMTRESACQLGPVEDQAVSAIRCKWFDSIRDFTWGRS